MKIRTCALAALLLVSGCATTTGGVTLVPVPVECREKTPDAPVLPVDGLKASDPLDTKVAAALASIERLRGYVSELLAALTACQQPLTPSDRK